MSAAEAEAAAVCAPVRVATKVLIKVLALIGTRVVCKSIILLSPAHHHRTQQKRREKSVA